MTWRRSIALAVLIGCLGGCSAQKITFHPPELEPQAVATLRPQRGLYVPQVAIEFIDGVLVRTENRWWVGPAKEATVAPGRHVIEVSYFSGDSYSLRNFPLLFEAEAGKTYEIRAARTEEGFWSELGKSAFGGKGTWWAWMVDSSTGQVVAGRPAVRSGLFNVAPESNEEAAK